MKGKIIKSISGVFFIESEENVYEAKQLGSFKKLKMKPLVGDIANFVEKDGSYLIESIEERKNELIRPIVANVDNLLIVMTISTPSINLLLLDKFLVMAEYNHIRPIIIINKKDIKIDELIYKMYKNIGYDVFETSIYDDESIHKVLEEIKGQTSVLSGPSGVGKSSIMNYLNKNKLIKTQEISMKLNKGKQTTRSVQLYSIDETTSIIDTPGFTSLELDFLQEEDELKNYIKEFNIFKNKCRFASCVHINEPDCEIKKQVEEEKISSIRYKNYLLMYEEIKAKRRYWLERDSTIIIVSKLLQFARRFRKT